jgi:hypothetical protein
MKKQVALVGVLLVCLGIAAGEDAVLAIVDKSPAGSPLQNIGSVTFSETAVGGAGVAVSHRDDWTVKNVSQKPIVAIVETLLIRDDKAVNVGREARYDAFFHPTLAEPGQAISPFSQDFFEDHVISSKYTPLVSARCEVTVRWVQFADGTTFGDNSYASPLIENRTAILKALQQLHEVYLNEGPEKFIEQLQQPVKQPDVDGYLEHLRILQKKGGAARAVEALAEHLNVGQQRADLNASTH